jgi:Zn-dependent protease
MEAVLIGIIILVFSAILHEVAHGYIAYKLGDPTAKIAGRLTLNPLPHIDPIMTILVPLLLYLSPLHIIFGGAKPVPINPLMLREGRKDVALVALAGSLTNLIIVFIASFLYRILFPNFDILQFIQQYDSSYTLQNYFIAYILYFITSINLALGIFNLIPVPPLDGSKFFSIVLPERAAQQYFALAPFGIFILFILLLSTPVGDILNLLIINSLHLLGI